MVMSAPVRKYLRCARCDQQMRHQGEGLGSTNICRDGGLYIKVTSFVLYTVISKPKRLTIHLAQSLSLELGYLTPHGWSVSPSNSWAHVRVHSKYIDVWSPSRFVVYNHLSPGHDRHQKPRLLG